MPSDYIALVADAARDGDRCYAAAARELVRRTRPQGVAAVREAAFEEPLVFAAFSSGMASTWLDQLLWGYLRDGSGASGRRLLPGPDGSVYVPGVGTWSLPERSSTVEARWCEYDGSFHLYSDGRRVDVEFRPIVRLGPAGTELVEGGHPLLDRFYADRRPGGPEPGFAGLAEAHAEDLQRALAVIAEVAPSYADPLLAVVRKVILHYGDRPPSFAVPGVHGAVFLNMALGDDEVSFVEDLVYQGGHVLFSAASFDRERWFRVDRNTPLGTITGIRGDRRSLYVALHWAFTEAAMIDVLDSWYDSPALSQRQRHEIRGRLAFTLRRLAIDLRCLAAKPVLDAEGSRLLGTLAEVWRDVSARRPRLHDVRLEKQAYRFDYQRFAALNSPIVSVRS